MFLFVGMKVPVSIITEEEKRISGIVMVLMLILKKCVFGFVTFIGLQGDVDKRFTPNKKKRKKTNKRYDMKGSTLTMSFCNQTIAEIFLFSSSDSETLNNPTHF